VRTIRSRVIVLVLLCLICGSLLASSPGALAPGAVRYIVTLNAGAQAPDIAALGGRAETIDGSVLTVLLPARAAKALANDPAVQAMREAVPSPQPAMGVVPSHRVKNDRFRLTPQDAITLWGSGEYVYDGAGNITAMGTASALNGDGKTSTFTYDLASRLQGALIGRASGGDISESYAYDGFGNLTKHQRDTPGTPVIYSPLPNLANNRMTESGVSYDPVGNVTALAYQTLTYDAFNQVTSKYATVTPPPATPDYTYIYDVNEERIGIQQGSATTHWTIRDFDNKPLIAFDSPPASTTQTTQWTWVESFAWAGGKMLMAERPAVGPLHYHVDHFGSTRAITDANGQLVAGSRVDYARRRDHHAECRGAEVHRPRARLRPEQPDG